jgi:hypothetical protein
MRIYNNTSSQIEFDLTPSRKIVVSPHQYSGNFLPNTDALDRLVKVFTPNQIAFLVSGTVEMNLCANTKSTVTGNFVCSSFEEVTERFGLEKEKKEEEKPVVEEKKEAAEEGVLKEKVIEAAPEVEEEPVVENTPVTEPEANTTSKKSRKKKKD